jgi:hypothetical protein
LRVTVLGLRIVTASAAVVGISVAADQVEQAGEGALSHVAVAFQFPDALVRKQSVVLDPNAGPACDANTNAPMSATKSRLGRARLEGRFKAKILLIQTSVTSPLGRPRPYASTGCARDVSTIIKSPHDGFECVAYRTRFVELR